MSFSIIVAADEANGIGKDGQLPWRLPGDMAFFKRTTLSAPEGMKNAVIMGRKTYDSIPRKFRPLEGRLNLVLSRDSSYAAGSGVLVAQSIEQALREVATRADLQRVFVIGGGQIYADALTRPDCAEVLLTRVHARFDCDTRLPALDATFALTHSDGPHQDGTLRYTFETYTRR